MSRIVCYISSPFSNKPVYIMRRMQHVASETRPPECAHSGGRVSSKDFFNTSTSYRNNTNTPTHPNVLHPSHKNTCLITHKPVSLEMSAMKRSAVNRKPFVSHSRTNSIWILWNSRTKSFRSLSTRMLNECFCWSLPMHWLRLPKMHSWLYFL